MEKRIQEVKIDIRFDYTEDEKVEVALGGMIYVTWAKLDYSYPDGYCPFCKRKGQLTTTRIKSVYCEITDENQVVIDFNSRLWREIMQKVVVATERTVCDRCSREEYVADIPVELHYLCPEFLTDEQLAKEEATDIAMQHEIDVMPDIHLRENYGGDYEHL